MTLIYGQLEKAQMENLGSNPAAGVLGRFWYNTADGRAYVDETTLNSAMILNNQRMILGTNGTAANNVRINRSANASLQLVPGNDATAEGSLATTLATLGKLVEKFTTAGRPAASVGNAGRIILDTDLDLLLVNSNAGAWVSIGSGSSSSGKNYIDNPSAVNDISGWVTYADAAGTSPVNGTGGSPASTFVRNTTGQISGAADFLWTKSAANRQGEGFSYDFTVDIVDQATMQTIAFDYKTSAAYVDGDQRVYVYDVTNSLVIEPAEVQLMANEFGHALVQFQTSANSTSYRLIIHTASTSALAYTVNYCNFQVGPRLVARGPVVTDWKSFTPTGTWNTNVAYTGFYKRIGDMAHFTVKVLLSGAPNAVSLAINLPFGWNIDTTKYQVVVSTIEGYFGISAFRDAGTQNYLGRVGYRSATAVEMIYETVSAPVGGISSNITETLPFTWASGDYILCEFAVPIVGWSSNQVVSEDVGAREISFLVNKNATQAIATTAATKVTWQTVVKDKTGSFDTTNSRFVCPESGLYSFNTRLVATSFTANEMISLSLRKNGTLIRFNSGSVNSTNTYIDNIADLDLIKGDYVEVFVASTADASYTIDNDVNIVFFSGFKVQSNQQIAASELVSFKFSSNAGQAVTSGNAIVFEDTENITHPGFYNTTNGQFTSQSAGWYTFQWMVNADSVAATVGNVFNTILYDVTGAANLFRGFNDVCEDTTSRRYCSPGCGTVYLPRGKVVEVRFNETLPAVNLVASSDLNFLSIQKLGGIA